MWWVCLCGCVWRGGGAGWMPGNPPASPGLHHGRLATVALQYVYYSFFMLHPLRNLLYLYFCGLFNPLLTLLIKYFFLCSLIIHPHKLNHALLKPGWGLSYWPILLTTYYNSKYVASTLNCCPKSKTVGLKAYAAPLKRTLYVVIDYQYLLCY